MPASAVRVRSGFRAGLLVKAMSEARSRMPVPKGGVEAGGAERIDRGELGIDGDDGVGGEGGASVAGGNVVGVDDLGADAGVEKPVAGKLQAILGVDSFLGSGEGTEWPSRPVTWILHFFAAGDDAGGEGVAASEAEDGAGFGLRAEVLVNRAPGKELMKWLSFMKSSANSS